MTVALARTLAADLPTHRARHAAGSAPRPALPLVWLVVTVLLPFAIGFHLSYVFRSINVAIAGSLRAEFDLTTSQLGLMTSMFFLAFASVLLPLGVALDRYGPRRVQSLLMVVAAAGAMTFAWADGLPLLILGRCLIGVGVGVALMAGLKAVVLWVPAERMALANGCLMMFGSLGAVTATAPATVLLDSLGWRGLFEMLALSCILTAFVIHLVVPEQSIGRISSTAPAFGVRAIYADRRFWRVAPVAASVVATSWSLQGLWAAPWLGDVEGLPRAEVVHELLLMGMALSAGGVLLGLGADRLRHRGVSPPALLAVVAALSILAQVAIIWRWPVAITAPWSIIAISGAGSVLGYASITELFPKSISGRATAALNLLQIGGAFAIQCATGFIIALWPEQDGHPPTVAYQAAFAIVLSIQVGALGWFLLPRPQTAMPVFDAHAIHLVHTSRLACLSSVAAYDRAAEAWMEHLMLARHQARRWRLMGFGSAILTLMLVAVTVEVAIDRTLALAHVIHLADATGSQAPFRDLVLPDAGTSNELVSLTTISATHSAHERTSPWH
jgi:MFS family permease